MKTISVVDYQIGNIESVSKALKYLGAEIKLVSTAEDILNSGKLILPGVSAFGAAVGNLKKFGIFDAIKEFIKKGNWFLGICVGLQLLFDESEESPNIDGLKIIDGKVKKFDDKKLIVPHMGWNTVNICKQSSFFKGVNSSEAYFYFVHSYYVEPSEKTVILSTTEYDSGFCSAIECNNIIATQFHPEKSQINGLICLKNFLEL